MKLMRLLKKVFDPWFISGLATGVLFYWAVLYSAEAQPNGVPAGYGVDYSVNHACDPANYDNVVTWGTGGDFDPANGQTIKDAARTLPRQGRSMVGILTGNYSNVRELWMPGNFQDLTICGLSAERPVLNVNNERVSFGDIGRATLQHVELAGGGIVMRNGRWGGLSVAGVFLHHNTNSCIESGILDSGWLAERGQTLAAVNFVDLELWACGQGNTKHNIYLSSRNIDFRANRISSYGANESHGFKFIGKFNKVTSSYFSTVTDWNDIQTGPWSTTLVDTVACSQSVIAGNYFKLTLGDADTNFRGSAAALSFRARRGIRSCDQPPYDSPEFNDPAFWADVKALPITDPNNPHSFKLFVAGNTFELIPSSDKFPMAVKNDGTAPRKAIQQFSGCSVFLSAPEEWAERAVLFSGNNRWIGLPTLQRYNLDFAGCNSSQDEPGALYPPPPRPHVHVGGDDGSPVTLPEWFDTAGIDTVALIGGDTDIDTATDTGTDTGTCSDVCSGDEVTDYYEAGKAKIADVIRTRDELETVYRRFDDTIRALIEHVEKAPRD